ncbi:MAG: hypothetical protein V4671_13325 [Armatimonadota bacterium]
MSEMFDDKRYDDFPPFQGEKPASDEAEEALPFERTPYALWAYEDDGTLPTRAEEATFVLHKDLETEYLHVMLFETLDDAYKTLSEFKAATGRNAEPKRTDIRAIGEHFYIRLFRADGTWQDMSLQAYLRGTE